MIHLHEVLSGLLSIFWFLLLTFLVSLLYIAVIAAAIIFMQPDYFIKNRSTLPFKKNHPWAWFFGKGLKNIIGILLVLSGIVMLVAPGQGLLTVLVGLSLMDFPGKRNLEIYLIRKPAIHLTINKLRKFAGKPPLEIP